MPLACNSGLQTPLRSLVSSHASLAPDWAPNSMKQSSALTAQAITQPPATTCQTAFAAGGTCFSSLPAPYTSSERWGWFIPLASGSFDLYAGAGQCDTGKGTRVGRMTVDCTGGCKFTYSLESGFTGGLRAALPAGSCSQVRGLLHRLLENMGRVILSGWRPVQQHTGHTATMTTHRHADCRFVARQSLWVTTLGTPT